MMRLEHHSKFVSIAGYRRAATGRGFDVDVRGGDADVDVDADADAEPVDVLV